MSSTKKVRGKKRDNVKIHYLSEQLYDDMKAEKGHQWNRVMLNAVRTVNTNSPSNIAPNKTV